MLMLMTLAGAPIPAIRQSGVGRKGVLTRREGGRNIAVINQDFLFGADGEKLERRRTIGREGRQGLMPLSTSTSNSIHAFPLESE